jgi:hypothetical protein
VARLEKMGEALMILALDEPAGDEHIRQILAVKHITAVKLVKL